MITLVLLTTGVEHKALVLETSSNLSSVELDSEVHNPEPKGVRTLF
jgi:hypothetical protein